MKKEELNKLEVDLFKEQIKRQRIMQLQDKKEVEEYLNLIGLEKKENETKREILSRLIENVELTDTNNIWVLISAFKREIDSSYENIYTFLKEIDLNDKNADGRKYINIENLKINIAYFDKRFNFDKVDDFEKNNIVLNPNNKTILNGFIEIREDFVMNSINYGEDKAKELLLKKYPKL